MFIVIISLLFVLCSLITWWNSIWCYIAVKNRRIQCFFPPPIMILYHFTWWGESRRGCLWGKAVGNTVSWELEDWGLSCSLKLFSPLRGEEEEQLTLLQCARRKSRRSRSLFWRPAAGIILFLIEVASTFVSSEVHWSGMMSPWQPSFNLTWRSYERSKLAGRWSC